jgi:hypothetical protein
MVGQYLYRVVAQPNLLSKSLSKGFRTHLQDDLFAKVVCCHVTQREALNLPITKGHHVALISCLQIHNFTTLMGPTLVR